MNKQKKIWIVRKKFQPNLDLSMVFFMSVPNGVLFWAAVTSVIEQKFPVTVFLVTIFSFSLFATTLFIKDGKIYQDVREEVVIGEDK